jgi:hypothetical protein
MLEAELNRADYQLDVGRIEAVPLAIAATKSQIKSFVLL